MHRLADDALRRNQITRALEYARDLDSLSNRDFSDRLLLLSILKAANEAETQSLLEQLKKDASDDAVKIGALIGWMNSQKMSAAAVAWMKTLPPTLLVKRTTPLNLADAFMATSDWEGLRNFAWERSGMLSNTCEMHWPRGRSVSWARCRNQVSNGRKRSLRLVRVQNNFLD